jgi:peptidyl-prolyl cis-trans isomerase SurA
MNKKIIIFTLSCIFLMTSAFAIDTTSPTISLDRVVAVVNTDVITSSRLKREIAIYKSEAQQAKMKLPSDNILRQRILQQLINQRLQLQIANSTGIHVSDAELNVALQRLAKQRKMSLNSMYQQVQKIGYTIKEFHQEIRKQIKIEKLQRRDVTAHIRITPQEVNDFLLTVKLHGQSINKEYHLQNILIPLPDAPTPSQIVTANKKAKDIMQQLKQGANFRKLAMTKSSGSKALQGGDLGWRKIAELPVVFAAKIKTMKTGGVAGPIRTSNGIHIIKLLGTKMPSSSQPVNKKAVERMIFQRKVNEALEQYINTLRGQVYIKVVK